MIIKSPPKLTNRKYVVEYVEVDLWSWLKQLTTGILKLNFNENFQSFTVTDIDIPAGMEVSIPNEFGTVYPGLIPSQRIITRQQGDANIIDGPTEWTDDLVYLYNPSGNDATITVTFLV